VAREKQRALRAIDVLRQLHRVTIRLIYNRGEISKNTSRKSVFGEGKSPVIGSLVCL
jgi:hypothetical protein